MIIPTTWAYAALALLSLCAEARVVRRSDCTSNADCLRKGRGVLPPRRYYVPNIDARAANSFSASCTTANSTGGVQTFQPSISGSYSLQIQGAQGANYGSSHAGGKGASFTTTVTLDAAQTYGIIVGCPGYAGTSIGAGGGGGGSFVFVTSTTTLIAAAGGGGAGANENAGKAASSDFTGAGTKDAGNFGTAATGGQGGTLSTEEGSTFLGGAGAGWLTNGASASDAPSGHGGYAVSVTGSTQADGGAGGLYSGTNGGGGGFGGGGGGGAQNGGGGSGGGYSGGNGGGDSHGGGGGGNFVYGSASGTSAITLVSAGGLVSISPI